jgi:hypothetical protein
MVSRVVDEVTGFYRGLGVYVEAVEARDYVVVQVGRGDEAVELLVSRPKDGGDSDG